MQGMWTSSQEGLETADDGPNGSGDDLQGVSPVVESAEASMQAEGCGRQATRTVLVSGVCMDFVPDGYRGGGVIEYNGQDVLFTIHDCVDYREPEQGDVLVFKLKEEYSDERMILWAECVMTPSQVRDRSHAAYTGRCLTFDPDRMERGICVKILSGPSNLIRPASWEGGIYAYLTADECIGTYPCKGDIVKFDIAACSEIPNRRLLRAVTGGSRPKHFHGMRWVPGEGFRERDPEFEGPLVCRW